MNKAIVIGGTVVLGLGLVALSSSKSTSTPRAAEPFRNIRGFPQGGWSKFKTELADYQSNPKNYNFYAPGGRFYDYWQAVKHEFTQRAALLPANQSGVQDAYTKERYQLPSQIGGVPTFGSIDEFGRAPGGLPSNFGASVLSIAQTVAPLIPGYGQAASAALAYAIAIGQGKSQQDALLAAGRAAIPFQYRYAFDMAVGIADGQSVPEAAKNALLTKYPEARKAFEKGKELAPVVRNFT